MVVVVLWRDHVWLPMELVPLYLLMMIGDEVLKYMERVLKGIKFTFNIPVYTLY